MKTYVIGNEDAILGFSLVGIQGRAVRDSAELEAALQACLADKAIGLLLITGDVAQFARERIDALRLSSLAPLVVEIPGSQGEAPGPSFREFVQRAVGVSLGDQ